jgi:hypothetical protein
MVHGIPSFNLKEKGLSLYVHENSRSAGERQSINNILTFSRHRYNRLPLFTQKAGLISHEFYAARFPMYSESRVGMMVTPERHLVQKVPSVF